MDILLDKYIKNWGLDSIQELVTTQTSDLFKADSIHGPVVLKILTEAGIQDELRGIEFLEAMHGRGAVTVFKKDSQASLIEFLPGEDLYQFSKNGDEKRASKVFVDVIKMIRQSNQDQNHNAFRAVEDLYKVFEEISYPKEIQSQRDKAIFYSKQLLADQMEEEVLHGDLHHENIRQGIGGLFKCFDAKGLRGDPHYEVATILKNPWNYPSVSHDEEQFLERAKFFAAELGYSKDRILKFTFVHLIMSIGWAIEDEQGYAHQQKIASVCEKFIP